MSLHTFYVYNGVSYYKGKDSRIDDIHYFLITLHSRSNNNNRNKKIKKTIMKKRWFIDGVTSIFSKIEMKSSNLTKGKKNVLA
jgi:hypothetical protein